MTSGVERELSAALPDVAREVEEFVGGAGWDQPPQLFALVRTAELVAAEPAVGDRVDRSSVLTPVAQEPLPDGELDLTLAGITWPAAVAGCAAAVQVVVLPPGAEAELDSRVAAAGEPADLVSRLAAEHPEHREARLVAAVLRGGAGACVLRLRGDADTADELVERPDLAPNLLDALRATLEP